MYVTTRVAIVSHITGKYSINLLNYFARRPANILTFWSLITGAEPPLENPSDLSIVSRHRYSSMPGYCCGSCDLDDSSSGSLYEVHTCTYVQRHQLSRSNLSTDEPLQFQVYDKSCHPRHSNARK